MAFGGFSDSDSGRPMAEINMIPLIDVMLVLLIIFIVTTPLLTHSIRIDLPEASTRVNVEKPETVTLSIDSDGQLFWNDAPITRDAMHARLTEAARQDPQPELHLRADKTTQYQRLAEVMAAAQTAGLAKIGFITEPVGR
ncbi:MAG TPA: biopolymer transporter ExbD [Burkholderiales bacterium]|nr:biopolymer transporter ExbD [Burkholderiales bacterium]